MTRPVESAPSQVGVRGGCGPLVSGSFSKELNSFSEELTGFSKELTGFTQELTGVRMVTSSSAAVG